MPTTKPLTDTQVRNLKSTGGRYEVPDVGAPGLAVRVGTSGTKTWTLTYRVRGQGAEGGERVTRLASGKRRVMLGEFPKVTLADARARAAEIKRQARQGLDAARPTLDAAPATTVADLLERYVRDHLQRRQLRAAGNAEKQLRLHVLPTWGDKAVVAVGRADLVQLLEVVRIERTVERRDGTRVLRLQRGGPGAASEVRKWTRGMFQFAVDAGLRPDNPFTEVKNRDKQRHRERVLTMAELAAVWAEAEALGYPWGPWYQLIMLTGDRRSEWARARWEWLNTERTELTIPASEYKTGKAQLVPLSSQARAILAILPKPMTGTYLFSSDGGATAVSGFSKAKLRLDARLAKREGALTAKWVVHDLRRTMATHMERIGVAPHVIEVCLGHKLKGVAGTYRQYAYLPEKREALQRWADEVLGAVSAANKESARAPSSLKSSGKAA